MALDAYLDIETTGLGRAHAGLTVVGVAIADNQPYHVIQLIGDQVTKENLLGVLRPVKCIYTYNGTRFDLPFIKARLGLDLRLYYRHVDLMYYCWHRNLKGGLKAVERQLRIRRDSEIEDIDGRRAVELWWRYVKDNDTEALERLLEYNRQDVLNLYKIRLILGLQAFDR